MKKLFLAALLVVGMTTFAQEKQEPRRDAMENGEREKLTPEQRVNFQLKRMTKDLSLDAKQVEQVKNLLTQEAKKREEKRTEIQALRANGEKLSADQKKAMKTTMEAERNAMNDEMKKILSPDQFTKWQQRMKERKEKGIEKIKNRRQSEDKPSQN